MTKTRQNGATQGITPRNQRTLRTSVKLLGYGLFRGLDVEVELCPAPEHSGLRFSRTDLPGAPEIPATVEYVVEEQRRTALANGPARVETTEHLLAALAACRVDNCLIRINGPELPTFDGSSLAFLEAIDKAGVEQQSAPRPYRVVNETLVVCDAPHVGIAAQPPVSSEYNIGYVLNYGSGPIPPQSMNLDISPDLFRAEIGFARTFALEAEVRQLQAAGLGLRATARDVVVFGEAGIIQNSLRVENECVRHKILDCIGDFALAGCDLHGRITALRSGHRLNHELVRRILQTCCLNASPRNSQSSPLSLDQASHLISSRIAG